MSTRRNKTGEKADKIQGSRDLQDEGQAQQAVRLTQEEAVIDQNHAETKGLHQSEPTEAEIRRVVLEVLKTHQPQHLPHVSCLSTTGTTDDEQEPSPRQADVSTPRATGRHHAPEWNGEDAQNQSNQEPSGQQQDSMQVIAQCLVALSRKTEGLSASGGRTPFQKPKLPIPGFDPSRTVLTTWIPDFEYAMRHMGYETSEYTFIAESYLWGEAKTWLNAQDWKANSKLPRPAWEELKTALETHFGGRVILEKAVADLADGKQAENMSVDVYKMEKERAINAYDPNMDEDKKKEWYLRGLLPSIRQHLVGVEKKTLQELHGDARLIEKTVPKRTSWTSKPPKRPSEKDRRNGMAEKHPANETAADTKSGWLNKSDEEERQQMRKFGLCFLCKKQGHLAKNCPERSVPTHENPSGEQPKPGRSGNPRRATPSGTNSKN